jgi:hypothetical protein
MDPNKAAAIGARKQQMDQSEPGAITKEHAAALHDMAHKAGANEADLDAFGRVLSALAGTDPTTQDRGGGSGKISRARAHKAWSLAKDKLSPADLAKFTEMIRPMVDWDLPDEDEEGPGAMDSAPSLAERERFLKDHPEIARIKPDDHFGVPVPTTRRQRQQSALALDAAQRGGGKSFAEEWPEVARLIR